MTTQSQKLPYDVGRLNGGWRILVVVLLVLIGFGGYAYYLQFTEGEIVTGMRDIGTMGGATWGIYIAFVVYFVGVSFAGITIAALIRLLGLNHLKPISRMAEALTVITLLLGSLSILADVGQPVRAMLNLIKYVRPGSPFFGTFTLVISGYLFGSVVYLYLDGRRDAAKMAKLGGRFQGFYRLWAAGYRGTEAERERHSRASFWLAIAIIPLLITAHSTLGFIFGLQVGRPGWFGALQAPGFVVMAGVSGIGLIIIIAAVLRLALNLKEQLKDEIFRWMGNFLMILIAVYLYFMVVEWLTTIYTAHEKEQKLSEALLTGEYAGLFWVTVAFLVIPLVLLAVQYFQRRNNLALTVLSGVLVNLAAMGKRYLVVVPSQTHGTLLPYGVGSYSPTWVEYGVIVGLMALGVLLFVIFIKVFPIMEVPEPESPKRRRINE